MKCIVKGCPNTSEQGNFVGNLCAPCHQYLSTGIIGSTASFLGDLVNLNDLQKTELEMFSGEYMPLLMEEAIIAKYSSVKEIAKLSKMTYIEK